MRKSRKKNKKYFYHKKSFWLIFLLISVSLTLFYLIVFLNYFWVNSIEVSGNQRIKTQDLEESIDQSVSRKVLFWKTRNIFLFDPYLKVQELIEEYPVLSGLKITKKYPDKIILSVQERKAVATLCNSECFLIDSSGFLFEKAEKRANFNIKVDHLEPFLGKKALGQNEIKGIIYLWKETNEAVGINEFQIEDFNLYLYTKENWIIKFNLKEDIELQALKLKMVLEDKIPQEKRKNLEYIDLRFKGIYFKYRS
jgi:hypothetical protein